VEVAILAVPAALSRLGVLVRYWQETQRYGHGRVINNAVHDACYHGVLNEAGAVDTGNVHVDTVAVLRRGNEALYSNSRAADGAWRKPPTAADAVRRERTRPWTPEESARFARTLAQLRTELGAEWSLQLDDIADLAQPLLTGQTTSRPTTLTGGTEGLPPGAPQERGLL
jgi:hypothetical protein